MALNVYLGIDVGSVTTKLALVDESGKYVDSYMLRTSGKPVIAVQKGMQELAKQALCEYNIQGVVQQAAEETLPVLLLERML